MEFFSFLNPVKIQKTPSTYKFSFRAKVITLWIAAAVLALFLFRFSSVLPVFIWAAVTAYLFNPIITFFTEKTRFPRAIWILILYVLLFILTFFILKSVAPLISNEIADLLSGSLDDPRTFLGKIASQGNVSLLGIDINLKHQVILFSSWLKSQIPMQLFPLFFGAVEKMILLLIYLMVTFYLILDSGKFVTLLKRIIPVPYRQEIFDLLENTNITLGAYIRAQVVLIIIMSIASFVVLSVLQIKYAYLLSTGTGILEVIPIAGPILATTIVATVALFQTGTAFGISNGALAVIIVICYFVLRQLEDYFIIPNVVSKFVKVHPVLALFALMVGGSVGGVLGLFLAIPSAAIIMVFSSYIYKKLTED